MDDKLPQDPPSQLREPGRRLWSSIVDEFALEGEHERALLLQACITLDVIDALDAAVGDNLIDENTGKVKPAAIECRQQRITFGRLIAALRVPLGDSETTKSTSPTTRLQRRATRGVYAL